jgi:hypothetical protein
LLIIFFSDPEDFWVPKGIRTGKCGESSHNRYNFSRG